MNLKCPSCDREMNLDQQVFSDFMGFIKCDSCCSVMEMQTMRGVPIWIWPLSGMKVDLDAIPSEHNLYAGIRRSEPRSAVTSAGGLIKYIDPKS